MLTTADEMFDRTLVRLQKGGRGLWRIGEVKWIDYHANLALVTTKEADFWRDLKPAALGSAAPAQGAMQILRWREGNLEEHAAEFTQFSVREGQLSPINQVVLEVSSEIRARRLERAGGAQFARGGPGHRPGRPQRLRHARLLHPEPCSRPGARAPTTAWATFTFFGNRLNSTTLSLLGLPGEPRGALVVNVPPRPDGLAPVRTQGRPFDVDGPTLTFRATTRTRSSGT